MNCMLTYASLHQSVVIRTDTLYCGQIENFLKADSDLDLSPTLDSELFSCTTKCSKFMFLDQLLFE